MVARKLWAKADVIAVFASQFFLPIALVVCISIDIDTWQTLKLCEQQANCLDTLILGEDSLFVQTNNVCQDMDEDIRILFFMYVLSISSEVCRLVLFFVFVISSRLAHTKFFHLLDWYNVERGISGVAFWIFNLILNTISLGVACFRLIILPFFTIKYSSELYPLNEDATTLAFIIAYAAIMLTAYAISLYIVISRTTGGARFFLLRGL